MRVFVLCRALSVVALGAILAGTAAAGASNAATPGTSAAVPWQCSVPLLANPKADSDNEPDLGEGVSYLYIGDSRLQSNYGADALFTVPLSAQRGWYDSGMRLGPLAEDNGFVQIEISRWKRFDYKQHAAVSWSVPHGTPEHRDTGLMLDDATPHRLGISVAAGMVQLLVDSRVLCSTRSAYFVRAGAPKYFQVRTETGVEGANGDTRAADLRLQRDVDRTPQPYQTTCILHRHGIFWERRGGGAFAVRGAFYPDEATFFTGADASKPCTI